MEGLQDYCLLIYVSMCSASGAMGFIILWSCLNTLGYGESIENAHQRVLGDMMNQG